MSESAKLELAGESYELPVVTGSEGEKAIDISKLRAETGYVTLDNGYGNTGSCVSGITFLNGEKGILKYRGYPIEQLAESSNFMEVAYLLVNGELPTADQLATFNKRVAEYSEIPAAMVDMLKKYPKGAHPMAILSAQTVSLSAFFPDLLDQDLTPEKKEEVILRLIGQMKVLIANAYRISQGKDIIASSKDLDYSSDFLNMMFGEADVEVAKALDVLLILHADHEQNCSASAVRLIGSSKANLFATISGGIDALWGPLHGGANQAVIEMLEEIKNAGGDYKEFILKAKDKSDPFKLMGFGHRVYKNFDPRATIIKSACDTILSKLGVQDETLDIAKGLEEVARSDSYFVDRNLYPNVDFYSGIIYRALGIPTEMFTAMFALGRLPGWISQWKEMLETPGFRINRPRQIYTGETTREYVSIDKRK